MSLQKFKRKIGRMSDRDLHRLERRLDKIKSVVVLAGIPAIGGVVAGSILLGPAGLLGGTAGLAGTAYGQVNLGKRLDIIDNEIQHRNKIRREKRQRFMRELKLGKRSKLKKMM